MKTKVNRMASLAVHNLNPCGSPRVAAYSFMKYVSTVLLFLTLGIGNVWGSQTYYSTMKVAVTSGQTGYGTVYVNAAGTTSQTMNSSSTNSSVSHSYNIVATPSAGYKFSSWSGSGITFGNTASASTTGSISTSSTSSPGTSKTATASFVAVQVSAVDNTSIDLGPTNASSDYPFTVRFTTVNKNNLNDFIQIPATTDGNFTITWSEDGSNVKVTGKFNGGGSYGGANRTNSTTVSLQSKASGSTAKTCTVTANFPALAFVGVEATEVFATLGESGKTGSATFTYNYGAEDDFPTTPTIVHTSGSGAFAVTGYTVTPNFLTGVTTVTVNYEFNTNNGVGETVEQLKLTAANGLEKTVTITGHSEALATNDASVTPAGGSPTEYATFAQALAAANNLSGATLTLLRNVDLGTITATNNINKAMTIDLNGKELRAAVNAKQVGVLTVNANVVVTIKDSKTGGRIINEYGRNDVLYTINVAKGTLNLESGTISIHNTLQQSYGTAAAGGVATSVVAMGARAIQQAAATTVNINGGRVESYGTRAVYGIRTEGSKANNTTLNISGGEIYAESPAYVYAVFSNGKLNVSGGTITAKINNEVVNENTAYMEYIRTNNKLWDNRTYGLRGFGYGILLQGGNSVTANANYFGTLNMTGGTVNVINVGDPEMQANSTATSFIQSPLYGVYFNAAALNVKTGTASDGSYSQKYAAKGSITGGTISVTNSGRQSYGVWVTGNYNSFDNSYAPVELKNCTINVSSYYESYGVYATAVVGTTSDNASPNMGACYAGEVELTGATVTAETTTAATAYALFAHAVVGNVYKNATWTKAKNAGYPRVYDGEFGAAAKITVNSGTYTATSATTTAYAVGSTTRAKTTLSSETSVAANRELGGNAEAYPVLILHGGTFRGETGTTTSGAVLSGGYTTIDGGTYTAYSGSTTSRGIYATAGTLDVSNVEISASGTTTAYGIDLSCGISDYTGFKYYADATLKNLTVTATTRTGGEADAVLMEVTKRPLSTTTYNALSSTNKTNYGAIYQYGEYAVGSKCTIIGGIYTATSATATAYGVRMNSAAICEDVNGDGELAIGAAELSVKNATFNVETKGGATAYGIWAGGPATVDNSTFTVKTSTSDAFGIRPRYGKTTISNSTIDVTAGTATARGVYVEAAMSAISTSSGTTHLCGVQGFEITGELESNNNTITAKANGGNTAYAIQVIDAKGSATQTTAEKGLAFAGDHACAGKATINGGKYTATASGTTAYAVIVSDPTVQGEATATPECIINDGKFYGYATGGTYADVSPNGETGYFVLNGGYYVKDENLDKKLGEGMNKVAVKSGTPEYTEGYRWRVTDNMTGEAVCKIVQNSTSYASLEEALQVVNASPTSTWTIVMTANYTLSKGDYEIPANTTLLIPYKTGTGKGATTAIGATPEYTSPAANVEKYEAPTPLYKLTFANGVNMSVYGKIEASAVTYLSNQGLTTHGTGVVSGKYGWLYLNEGSHIDLESGSALYAWGYVTGKGEINAKNGSAVYEDFQMGDWRGGSEEINVQGNENGLDKKGVFLITHYYYQNIECPITYRAGAQGLAHGGTYMYKQYLADDKVPTQEAVKMIGTSGAMFLMDPATAGEDTWVRKEYDAETDYVNWTMNSGAKLGSVSLKMKLPWVGDIDVSSSDYVLPITSNFNIVANDGEIQITNHVCFLPGSKLTIKKEGTLTIPSGQRVFFYDQDNWLSYSGYWFNPYYSPSWKVNPRVATIGDKTKVKMPDAEVLVEGLLNVSGAIYTTAGGANIHSTRENAGKVKFGAALPAATAATGEATGSTTLYQWKAGGPKYDGKALNPAWLKNEDGTYSKPTSSNTSSGDTWVYMQSLTEDTYEWTKASEDGCFTIRSTGDTKTYVHPSDWVAVGSVNANHAYPSEDGTRMFVNTEAASTSASCKWWDVNKTPEVIDGTTYYVANNENFDNFGTYYYWDNTSSYWKPKKITVTWRNEDGTKITNGTYGDLYSFNTSPQFFGTNPKKTPTAIEKYDWIGWRDAEGNIYDKNATLPRATSNVTYTAYFNTTKYQYTITFKNDDNSDLWAGLVDAGTTGAELQALFETKYNEKTGTTVPQKTPTVDKVFTFTGWNTTLATVTAAATYTAQYSSSTRQYHVTFYNYDAVSVLYETDVDYNTAPTYGGVRPFRANTSAYSYEWTGWQQGATTYTTSATLPVVKGDISYIATFAQTELKYQVFFKRQDGSIIDAPFFSYEETPSAFPANPTMASTVSTDYTFREWSPATLVSVTEDGKVYTALFDESPRKYTAHFVNYNGTTLNADQTINYNTVPTYTGTTPTKPNDARNSYVFSGWAWAAGDGWEAGSVGLGEALPAIKGEITFTAQYTPTLLQFDVIYQREDGTVIESQKKKYGETTTPPSVNGYQDQQWTYTFAGWTPSVVSEVTADATYTATFNKTAREYTLSITTAEAGYGTITPSSSVSAPYGATVTTDGNVLKVNGATVVTATPAAATAQYTYAFDHWNNVPATVTGNVSIEAVFTRTENQYTVLWKSEDGTSTIETDDNQNYGAATAFNGTTPTKDATAQYTYTFDGWATEANGAKVYEIGATPTVSGAATYYAHFAQTTNAYTVTWKNADGTELEKDEDVAYGAIPSFDGTTPTKDADARYSYTFKGWSPEITAVTADATYTAQFSSTPRSYAVTLNVNGGSINAGAVEKYTYGTGATLPTDVTKVGHKFDGWFGNEELTGDAVTSISNTATGDKTYWAKWTKLHAITWMTEGNVPLRTDYVADGEMPSYGQPNPAKDPTEQYTFTFEGWSPAVVVATEDASYTAQFQDHTRYYTITWKNYDGTVLKTDQNMQYGDPVSYDGDTPTKSGDVQHFYAFKGWYPEVTPDTKVAGDQEYVAQFGVALTVGVGENTEYEVSGEEDVIATTVKVAGHLKVPEKTSLTTTDLILEATPSTSGEITGAERVNVTGHAYFDLTLNTWARHWHAFGVPWKVGSLFDTKLVEIKTKNGEACRNELVLGRDYDIIHYNGETRAEQGPGRHCWDYVEFGDGTLDPGKAYMIGFIKPIGTVRFTKASEGNITTDEELDLTYYKGTEAANHGWNAIANPKTYHAMLKDAGVTFCQVQNGDTVKSTRYTAYSLYNYKFVVGTAVYVQVSEKCSASFSNATVPNVIGAPLSAPRRVNAQSEATEYFEVHLLADGKSSDRIYIKSDAGKEEDVYTTGIDVAKMGVSDMYPQLWIERYSNQLAVNTVAPVNDVATYPLSLFAPKADEYTVSTNATAEDNVTLYLTFDGRPIWNLTYSPYVTSLEKGTNRHYGLMLIRSKAPEVATGMGEVQDGTQPAAQKILLDGQVYILRGGELYSITGQSIK